MQIYFAILRKNGLNHNIKKCYSFKYLFLFDRINGFKYQHCNLSQSGAVWALHGGSRHARCEWLRLESCAPEKLAHSHVLSGEGRLKLRVELEEPELLRHLSFSLWSFQLAGFQVAGLTCLFRAHVPSLQEEGQALLPSVISL